MDESAQRQGQISIYAGEVRARTAMELGLVAHALGQHQRVCVVQFMRCKDGLGGLDILDQRPDLTLRSSEISEQFCATCSTFGDQLSALKKMQDAREAIVSESFDVVVLSEITSAIACGFVEEQEVVSLLRQRPAGTDVVVIGACVQPRLGELADSVTETILIERKGDVVESMGIEYWRESSQVSS
ncbi:MAG: cob(I)yrinic acid a,c-diamide adenosyltransferase [Chloroflexi bacterium]|nr:cob(I)yrinic acid a,c-diamide adenosyltransferase [Chloroflexota bacterium]